MATGVVGLLLTGAAVAEPAAGVSEQDTLASTIEQQVNRAQEINQRLQGLLQERESLLAAAEADLKMAGDAGSSAVLDDVAPVLIVSP